MREFSFALGVRCQYCHVGGDGVSFDGVQFDSDEDADKRKARFMLRMVENLNEMVLPMVPDRDDPPVLMRCKTCHRGQPKPLLLSQDLRRVLDRGGAMAAVARYRELRGTMATRGAFDFGEWEVNTLAEQLVAEGRVEQAIAIYEMNAEYHPESVAIARALGRLYEGIENVEAAIRQYERVLELRPADQSARERLAVLRAR